jgi:hypothetical protein
MPTLPTTLTDDEIQRRLDTIGAQFQVASPTRRDVLHRVVDELLDARAMLASSDGGTLTR